MSLPRNFVIVDGLITVEAILNPSWLVRRRIDDKSLTSPYVWVLTIAQQNIPTAYEIKGFLARNEHPLLLSDHRAMKRIVHELGLTYGSYERVDEDGRGRGQHGFDENAEKTG